MFVRRDVVDQRPVTHVKPGVPNGAEPPQLVLDDEAAEIGAEVAEQLERIQVANSDDAGADEAAGDQRIVDVVRAERVLLVVDVVRARGRRCRPTSRRR